MDEDLPQDVEETRSNDRHAKTSQRYNEDCSRSQYNDHRDERCNSESQYQQLSHQYNKYCRGIRRLKIPSPKWYGELNLSNSTDAGRWIGCLQRKRKQIHKQQYLGDTGLI